MKQVPVMSKDEVINALNRWLPTRSTRATVKISAQALRDWICFVEGKTVEYSAFIDIMLELGFSGKRADSGHSWESRTVIFMVSAKELGYLKRTKEGAEGAQWKKWKLRN